jgi:NADPH:quinone reductase-like Zn-dependent oxidoreductase
MDRNRPIPREELHRRVGATVIATCCAANADYVRDLGADEVIDYRTENVFARAQEFAVPGA